MVYYMQHQRSFARLRQGIWDRESSKYKHRAIPKHTEPLGQLATKLTRDQRGGGVGEWDGRMVVQKHEYWQPKDLQGHTWVRPQEQSSKEAPSQILVT